MTGRQIVTRLDDILVNVREYVYSGIEGEFTGDELIVNIERLRAEIDEVVTVENQIERARSLIKEGEILESYDLLGIVLEKIQEEKND
jgi:hypothetical protein